MRYCALASVVVMAALATLFACAACNAGASFALAENTPDGGSSVIGAARFEPGMADAAMTATGTVEAGAQASTPP